MSDEHQMTQQDYLDHAAAFETIEVELFAGSLVLSLGRLPDPPIRMVMNYGQAQALSKALGIGMAKLRGERAGRRDGA
jgi:hypothetical protein